MVLLGALIPSEAEVYREPCLGIKIDACAGQALGCEEFRKPLAYNVLRIFIAVAPGGSLWFLSSWIGVKWQVGP